MEANLRGRLPWLHMAHTWGHLKDQSLRHLGLAEPPERARTEAIIARSCDMLIASTDREKFFVTWSYGVDPDRVRIVPCGVDTGLFSPADRSIARQELGLKDSGTLLIFVGRLDSVKGIDVLLRALSLLRQRLFHAEVPSLLVIGGEATPGEAERLACTASQLGIADLVSFIGPVPHHRLPSYYRAADLLVMPSLYESFGMSLLEAMACGIPVVATKVDGPSNFVRQGVTGLLVPVGDVTALAEAVERLIVDKHMRLQMAKNALTSVLHYRWEAVAQSILEAYADTLCPVVRQRRLAV
jgi:D-inositol-3-phosphate glycosyltransferase